MAAPEEPAASVVIFCDYGHGGRTDWQEMKEVLRALARQDFPEPVEYILVESSDRRPSIPSDLADFLPSLRVLVVLDESVDVEKVTGEAAGELKSAIRKSLRKHGITLFPYIFLAKESELADTDEE